MQDFDVVILAATHTPMGSFQGALANLTAPELGARAIAGAVARSGLDGLEDAETRRSMGTFAQATADDRQIGRKAMDGFALESSSRARQAAAVPVELP